MAFGPGPLFLEPTVGIHMGTTHSCIGMYTDYKVKIIANEQGTVPLSPEVALEKLKEAAEAYSGREVKSAIMAVPAYFDEAQRQATREMSTKVGISVYRMIDEPTAAIVAYGLEKSRNINVLVLYLGAPDTFYISILNVDEEVVEVLTTTTHLQRSIEEELKTDLFETVNSSLEVAKLKRSDIHEILVVGRSGARIPKARELLKDYFDGKELREGGDFDEDVVHGATLLARTINRGIIKSRRYESVYGTCYFAIVSFGIETAGGYMTKLISRGTITPVKKSHIFTTLQDNQTSVIIKVYEGEEEMTKDCVELLRFNYSGITPAPRGVAQIRVSFDSDANGMLHVRVEDLIYINSESLLVPRRPKYITIPMEWLFTSTIGKDWNVEDIYIEGEVENNHDVCISINEMISAHETNNSVTNALVDPTLLKSCLDMPIGRMGL